MKRLVKTLAITILLFYLDLTSCTDKETSIPVVTTTDAYIITRTTASISGNVTDDGGAEITARGICWNVDQNPSISDNLITKGKGTGSFACNLEQLEVNTMYYARAYATNSKGTGYGNEISFKTEQIITVSDIDGNIYQTVKIGNQLWMAENLRSTTYSNGDLIGTTDPANKDITAETSPEYQWAYNGDESNAAAYGRLYTWYAVTDSRKLCPDGWHLPSDYEWTILTDFLSSNYGSGWEGAEIAKSMASISGWYSSSTIGTVGYDQASNNKSGFNALPAGYRNCWGGESLHLGENTYWWSASLSAEWYGTDDVYFRMLSFESPYVERSLMIKMAGLSVRCLKD
jgi:uncharacterized protein (TIGR02145 family)